MLRPYLDKKAFDKVQAGGDIASGFANDCPEQLHLARTGKMLVWVAVKGHADDWCVYAHFHSNGIDFARSNGDKVISKSNIDNILEVTDEVWTKYRF